MDADLTQNQVKRADTLHNKSYIVHFYDKCATEKPFTTDQQATDTAEDSREKETDSDNDPNAEKEDNNDRVNPILENEEPNIPLKDNNSQLLSA